MGDIVDIILPGNENSFTVGSRQENASIGDLSEFHRKLLDDPVTATLATINADGQPQLSPVWLNHDGTHINLNTVKDRLKDRNLRARPRCSIMVVDPESTYHWMTIYGEAVDFVDESDPARGQEATDNVNALSKTYIGEDPYPYRDPKGEERVVIKIKPTKFITFGAPE